MQGAGRKRVLAEVSSERDRDDDTRMDHVRDRLGYMGFHGSTDGHNQPVDEDAIDAHADSILAQYRVRDEDDRDDDTGGEENSGGLPTTRSVSSKAAARARHDATAGGKTPGAHAARGPVDAHDVDGADDIASAAHNHKQREQAVPAFLIKTYEILSKSTFHECVRWNAHGSALQVIDVDVFSAQVLPLYFKHNNFQSFVRQLNMYGFCKTRHDVEWREFCHPYFQRGRPDLLIYIKRKTNSKLAAYAPRSLPDSIARPEIPIMSPHGAPPAPFDVDNIGAAEQRRANAALSSRHAPELVEPALSMLTMATGSRQLPALEYDFAMSAGAGAMPLPRTNSAWHASIAEPHKSQIVNPAFGEQGPPTPFAASGSTPASSAQSLPGARRNGGDVAPPAGTENRGVLRVGTEQEDETAWRRAETSVPRVPGSPPTEPGHTYSPVNAESCKPLPGSVAALTSAMGLSKVASPAPRAGVPLRPDGSPELSKQVQSLRVRLQTLEDQVTHHVLGMARRLQHLEVEASLLWSLMPDEAGLREHIQERVSHVLALQAQQGSGHPYTRPQRHAWPSSLDSSGLPAPTPHASNSTHEFPRHPRALSYHRTRTLSDQGSPTSPAVDPPFRTTEDAHISTRKFPRMQCGQCPAGGSCTCAVSHATNGFEQSIDALLDAAAMVSNTASTTASQSVYSGDLPRLPTLAVLQQRLPPSVDTAGECRTMTNGAALTSPHPPPASSGRSTVFAPEATASTTPAEATMSMEEPLPMVQNLHAAALPQQPITRAPGASQQTGSAQPCQSVCQQMPSDEGAGVAGRPHAGDTAQGRPV